METDNLQRLKQIKCFLFDMDGTINLGMELIPGMEGFFEKLKEAGRSYYLVTNNSSKDHAHYVKKMNSMGVPVTKNNIMISSDALVNQLKHTKPGARLFVLGTPELKAAIKEGGFILTSALEEETDYVVVGFDQTLTYETLTIACRLIDRGIPYVATHPDVRCPIEGGEYIPDTGGHGQRSGIYYRQALRLYGRHGDGTDRTEKRRDRHGRRPADDRYSVWDR